MRSILCFLLLSVFAASVSAEDVVIDFRAGATKLGVFYQGNQEDTTLDLEVDAFKGFVEPYGHNTQYMKTGEAFVVRSTDFKLRVKVIVWANTDYTSKDERPYKITLKNLLMDEAVELKLSDKGGYQWIEEGIYVTHMTDVQHDFEFRDHAGETMLAVRLFHAAEQDL
ncbi:expressed unknown protein [Seminavis robusta]|uniref:Uncharacterized protein n=1 Tax=Seminavis robusta TaxID=568900 RepID=A0A9N8EYA6_9STRA|nr:expressed unknown protein [Seminavis robusta]|eukprot:Sro2101_g314540.1 n/a (168) ;mRNA; f:7286-7789